MELWWAAADPVAAKSPQPPDAVEPGDDGAAPMVLDPAAPDDDADGGWMLPATSFDLADAKDDPGFVALRGLAMSTADIQEAVTAKLPVGCKFAVSNSRRAGAGRKSASAGSGDDDPGSKYPRRETKVIDRLVTPLPSGVFRFRIQAVEGRGTKVIFDAAPDPGVPLMIFDAICDDIDRRLKKNIYWIQDRGPIRLQAVPADPEFGELPDALLLREMRHILTRDLRMIAAGGNADAVKLELYDPVSPDIMDVENYRCPIWKADVSTFWFPNDMPVVLQEVGRTAKLFYLDGGQWTGRLVPVGASSIYRFAAEKPLASSAIILPSTATRGGGGEMRADRTDEADYRWQGNPLLGAVAGFDPLKRGPRPDTSYIPVPLPIAGLQYWKKWNAGSAADKKNAPRSSFPQAPLARAKTGPIDSTKADFLQRLGQASLLRKKQKGQWDQGRLGVPLQGANAAKRLGAGAVMKAAFKTFGIDINGSATLYLQDVLAEELAANPLGPFATTWQAFSAGLRTRVGTPASVAASAKRIRTDQEWCHLYGHGDGGNETLENFVAGSKHANTEQLAIETAQRTRPGAVVGKITAYLAPANFVARTTFRDSELAILAQLRWPNAAKLSFAAFQKQMTPVPTTLPELEARLAALKVPIVYPAEARKKTQMLRTLAQELSAMLSLPQPIGIAVRYKISVLEAAPSKKSVKAFDHIIEMQRESFDLYQFRILYWAVRRAIAETMDAMRAKRSQHVPISASSSAAVTFSALQIIDGEIATEAYDRMDDLGFTPAQYGLPAAS
jgi:hypothetical protein